MASLLSLLLVLVAVPFLIGAAPSSVADQSLPITSFQPSSVGQELKTYHTATAKHLNPTINPQSLWKQILVIHQDNATTSAISKRKKLSEKAKKRESKLKKYIKFSVYESKKPGKRAKQNKKDPSSSGYRPIKESKKPRFGYYYLTRKTAESKAQNYFKKKKLMSKGSKKKAAITQYKYYKIRKPVPANYNMPPTDDESRIRPKHMMNRIDECWRSDASWAHNRMHLADCAIGYGFDAAGGKGGEIYVVTDPSDDDPASPKPGTLRYGVVQMRPLWIIFDHDMSITLENELIITSYKTIDGRGARVEIAYGPCFTIQNVNHVIIHGLSIHHCTQGKSGRVMSSTEHVGDRQGSDGDAIALFGASHIWIDHNYFANCQDGLVDAIHASTAITISNNFFTDHDKVMLLGHSDSYSADKNMRVTLVYNHFGPGLIQRMPRCRFGYFHVANNRYTKWGMYAIGASANPTIKSEGNYFFAPDDERFKQVVKLEGAKETSSSNWKSNGDLFLNGAYFGEDGTSSYKPSYAAYTQENFDVLPASLVPLLTADAGPLNCGTYSQC